MKQDCLGPSHSPPAPATDFGGITSAALKADSPPCVRQAVILHCLSFPCTGRRCPAAPVIAPIEVDSLCGNRSALVTGVAALCCCPSFPSPGTEATHARHPVPSTTWPFSGTVGLLFAPVPNSSIQKPPLPCGSRPAGPQAISRRHASHGRCRSSPDRCGVCPTRPGCCTRPILIAGRLTDKPDTQRSALSASAALA